MAGRKVEYIIDVDERGAVKGAQKTESALESLDKQAASTGKSGTQMAGQMQNAGKGVADLDRNARGANQVLFGMSDAIQDASFAGGSLANVARFAGNNVAQVAEQFGVMSQRAGGSRAAMQAVIGSLTGVGGVIFALNIGITALNLFGDALFSTEEKTEDLADDLDILATNWETAIRLQKEFGAFEDDTHGIKERGASIKQITENIQEERDLLEYINGLESERGDILANTRFDQADRLTDISDELELYRSSEEIQENISELERERRKLSLELVNIGEKLTDEDVQQAKAAQEEEERQKRLNEEKQRQLALERMIAQARASTRPDQPEDEIFMDIDIPDAPDLDLGKRLFPEGSLGELRQKLQGLKEELLTATDPAQINTLNESIRETQDEMNNLQGRTKEAGSEYDKQMGLAIASNIMLADSAEDAANRAIDAIIAQIVAIAIKSALEGLPFPANLIAAAGAAAAAKGLQSLIPEFALGGLAMGPSHSQGGIMGLIGGRPALELEGGEAIINKKSTRMFLPQLNAINRAGGGVPLAQDGALTFNAIGRGSAADLPMVGSGGGSLEGVLSELTRVLERGIRADVDVRQIDEELSNYQLEQASIGN